MKVLALAIKETAKIRESSWSNKKRMYNKMISQASEEVCKDKIMSQLVSMLLIACWNDALDWANEVLGEVMPEIGAEIGEVK